MGVFGTALYSDDLAADLRADLRECFGNGLSAAEAVDKLVSEYASSVADSDEGAVFWLAVADTGWKLGRLDDRALKRALEIIESGRDLARWPAGPDRRKRDAVLAKLRSHLLTPPPSSRRISRAVRAATDWTPGEVVAFQLKAGRWTLMRVIGYHEDKGGRFAVCELLDWTGLSIPSSSEIDQLPVRRGAESRGGSQFLFQEPKSKKDQLRIARTGVSSTPTQSAGEYSVFVWPYVDRLFAEVFGLG